MANTKEILLGKLRSGQQMTLLEQIMLTLIMSLPAILAQMSTVMMSYIDSAMVGRLGASQAAAIGLVSTSTWIFGGFCMATSTGFTVQVAHLVGAGNLKKAREVLRQGLFCVLLFSVVLSMVGLAISPRLPFWLGGTGEICADASSYFLVYAAFLPTLQLSFTAGAMLQSSGNMKVPSILNVVMCVLDVAFNYLFIFRLGMGVKGAALGTGLAEALTAVMMLWFLLRKSPELRITHEKGSFLPTKETLSSAYKLTWPMWLQNIISRGAYIASTAIVAPLGTIAIAANSIAITAESFCYMPGYGIQDAATSLIGQSLGAKRKPLARRIAGISMGLGALFMTLTGALMFILAPQLMAMLCPDPEVIALGAKVLRIEAFAETMYAVSIVGYGACVGGGDTFVGSLLNLLSMWVVRIGLALILTPKFGLVGYWIAMCIELNVRGLLFLFRVRGTKWMKLT